MRHKELPVYVKNDRSESYLSSSQKLMDFQFEISWLVEKRKIGYEAW